MFIVYSKVRQRAERLITSKSPDVFADRKIGLEKESLRVTSSGGISQSNHPESLGSALTHPSITTDFSEALLEMVTPPCNSAADAVEYLTGIHQFIVQRLPDNEHIWNTSMPCILRGGESVRIGEYGTSNSGQMKHAYRRGLGLRYGRRMQAIAGVHFNFSMPESSWGLRKALMDTPGGEALDDTDASAEEGAVCSAQMRTEGYFQMLQNLMRVGWIVPYLFGASPAICTSFLSEGEGDEFELWNQTTRYAPHGTSLRMGKIGYRYREDQPIDLSVSHMDVESYISDIIGHVCTPHPPYQDMGIRDENGHFQQLSAARLQIENEFYSTVRPKQIAEQGELPIYALRQRGIRYLELRSVDVNLQDPVGVSLSQVAMLEMLMMFAWLDTPSPLPASDIEVCSRNVQTVAHRGREPGLTLEGAQGEVALEQWGRSILDALVPIAQWLDSERTDALYVPALQAQVDKFDDPDLTPAAQMIAGIQKSGSFFDHANELSREHGDWLKNTPQDAQLQEKLRQLVGESRAKQAQMEEGSVTRFEDFLAAYLDQIRPVVAGG